MFDKGETVKAGDTTLFVSEAGKVRFWWSMATRIFWSRGGRRSSLPNGSRARASTTCLSLPIPLLEDSPEGVVGDQGVVAGVGE